MTTQAAWIAYLQGHAELTRELSARLDHEHGLSLNAYEVLLRLARAPERRLRRVDLAQDVYLTPSGITRLLDGLERRGWVQRASCASDRRVVYAVLTDEGLEKLNEAAGTHLADIDELFSGRFDDGELELLAGLLRRVAGDGDDASCSPD